MTSAERDWGSWSGGSDVQYACVRERERESVFVIVVVCAGEPAWVASVTHTHCVHIHVYIHSISHASFEEEDTCI